MYIPAGKQKAHRSLPLGASFELDTKATGIVFSVFSVKSDTLAFQFHL